MTKYLSGVWEHALKMIEYGFKIIPVEGKVAKLPDWPKKGRLTKDGVKRWAKLFPSHNYAIICSDFFVLEIDLDGADLIAELDRIREILGPFELGFMVKTGRKGVGYHIYCYSKGREIPTQNLTELTQIRGVNHYIVGPGSIHPETGAVYTPLPTCEGRKTDDPAVLTDISDETLDRLAKKRDVSQSADRTFALGDGEVLGLEHPPCIRRLIEKGAPTDQDYYQANHTIARYVISAGLSDADGAAVAMAMAKATTAHKTTKNEFDRVYNFRSCMNSARANSNANQFACSFVWGSKELCSGGLCNKCPHVTGAGAPTDAELPLAVRAEALRVMREEDPAEYIHNQYRKLHVSDEEMGSVLILGKAVQNVLNAGGIQPKASGASGKGKTHGKAAVVHLYPQEYVFRGSLSDKALFYHDIKPMTVLFLDDTTLSEPLEELARRSMTNFQEKTPHYTLNKATNKPVVEYLSERSMWAFANVDDFLDEQTVNRMVDVGVDETATADQKTHEMTANRRKAAEPRYHLTFEVLVCRDIYRILHEQIGPFHVSVPFADKIQWPHKENRRNFDIFLDFISGYAALRCMQRNTLSGVVFAERHDFEDAAKLYQKLYKTQTSKLNERQLAVVQAIIEFDYSATLNDLTAKLAPTGLKYDNIRKILHGRDGKPGLLGRVPGMRYENRLKTTSKTTKDDDGSETNTNSARANVYELPRDFKILEAYDEGSITLPDGADAIDQSTWTVGQHLDALGHFNLSQRKVDEIPSKEETDAIIEDYITILHTQTPTWTDFPRTPQEVRALEKNRENVCTREEVAMLPVQRVSVKNRHDREAQKEQQKGNRGSEEKGHSDTSPCSSGIQLRPAGHVPARVFIAKIGSFRYTGIHERDPQTPKMLQELICKEVADERCKHLDDVREDWNAYSNDPDMVRYIDEICGGGVDQC